MNFKNSKKDIKVFPNPVKDFLFINGLTNHTIKIFNLKGELEVDFFSKENITIDFSKFSNGIYLIEIKNKINQEIQITKVINQSNYTD